MRPRAGCEVSTGRYSTNPDRLHEEILASERGGTACYCYEESRNIVRALIVFLLNSSLLIIRPAARV
jgi:hypothetical protein